MKENQMDYKYCINLAIVNAKKRIILLSINERKCILEEYNEWMKEDFNYQTFLLLRDDPII